MNLCFLWPTRVHNPNGKSICSGVFGQLTVECRWVHWRHLANTTEINHIGAIWRIRLNSRFLRTIQVHNSNNKSIGSAVFAQMIAEYPYSILYNGTRFPPQNCPIPVKGSRPPSNTWFPCATRVLNPNGTWVGSAVFAGLTSVKDRQTDRQTTLLGR